jgi:hypothetical protein
MNTTQRQLSTLPPERWSNMLNLTTPDHPLLLSLPSAPFLPNARTSVVSDATRRPGLAYTPEGGMCAPTKRRGNEESGSFDVSHVERDEEKRVSFLVWVVWVRVLRMEKMWLREGEWRG